MEEIPELFESAVREAVAAFGRGECFVERYLDRPRHVETQILADKDGNVVVVGTRDCSLQRRYQKLVEEAPAPFLSEAQLKSIYEASKAICKEAGYIGAGTCEFLVAPDGLISFLEVNTRLQVEHPVTEEVSGWDLVRWQFAIAEGASLDGIDDPAPRGHSIEFRINGEDAGRGFLPAPGTVSTFVPPQGPGVRVDTGVESGSEISGAFDSLLAKIIVTGADRQQSLERARRVLDETIVEGMATVLPFHRLVVRDPAFAPADPDQAFTIHNRWIETEWDNTVEPFTAPAAGAAEPTVREKVTVEVGGKRLEVVLPEGFGAGGGGGGKTSAAKRSAPKRGSASTAAAASGDSLVAPMQGTIVKVAAADGDVVAAGDLIVVLEAMKMENPVTAHKAGVIKGLTAGVGEVVPSGTIIATIADVEG
jgi:acetyl-CoA/propionyl-CoA carboxylase biotin carboxyl carrier protein